MYANLEAAACLRTPRICKRKKYINKATCQLGASQNSWSTRFKTPDAALYAYIKFMMDKIQISRCSTLKNYSSMDECWLDSLWTCCLDGNLATSAIITSSNSTLCIPSKIKFVLQTQVSSHDMSKTCARHVLDMCRTLTVYLSTKERTEEDESY